MIPKKIIHLFNSNSGRALALISMAVAAFVVGAWAGSLTTSHAEDLGAKIAKDAKHDYGISVTPPKGNLRRYQSWVIDGSLRTCRVLEDKDLVCKVLEEPITVDRTGR